MIYDMFPKKIIITHLDWGHYILIISMIIHSIYYRNVSHVATKIVYAFANIHMCFKIDYMLKPIIIFSLTSSCNDFYIPLVILSLLPLDMWYIEATNQIWASKIRSKITARLWSLKTVNGRLSQERKWKAFSANICFS